jgi:hypothetical protein
MGKAFIGDPETTTPGEVSKNPAEPSLTFAPPLLV